MRVLKPLYALLGAVCCFGSIVGAADAATRVGLFYTQEEINVWKTRAVSGPYRITGDVAQYGLAAGAAGNYSPGQWKRVLTDAIGVADGVGSDNPNSFSKNPSFDRFANFYTGTSGDPASPYARCVPPVGDVTSYEPGDKGTRMVKAAFHYLVQRDVTLAARIKQELDWHISQPDLNFADTSRWCIDDAHRIGTQNPGFTTAFWLSRMLFSYDILAATGYIPAAAQGPYVTWFKNAANYMRQNYDTKLDGIYSNRAQYLLNDSMISATKTDAGYLMMWVPGANGTVVRGPSARKVSRYYNNRAGSMATFVGLVGVMTQDATLETSGTRFWKEWMVYGVRPDFLPTDLHRGLDAPNTNPFHGAGYAWGMIGDYIELADAKARRGNPELYTFKTRLGTNIPDLVPLSDNTAVPAAQATPKSLDQIILKMLGFQNGSLVGYMFATPPADVNEYSKYRINARQSLDVTATHSYAFDTWATVANRWYKNGTMRSNYTRTLSTTQRYPQYAANAGSVPYGYSFISGTMPAPLMQYEGMDAISVYPSAPFLQVDFGTAATESGFVKQGVASATHATSQGSVTVTVSGHGGFLTGGAQGDSGSFSYAQLYNDFVFNTLSNNNPGPVTFKLTGRGIHANTRYDVTVYGFDDDNSSTVALSPVAPTSGSSASIVWDRTVLPTANDQYAKKLTLTADMNGLLSFKAAPGSWAIRISGLKVAYAR